MAKPDFFLHDYCTISINSAVTGHKACHTGTEYPRDNTSTASTVLLVLLTTSSILAKELAPQIIPLTVPYRALLHTSTTIRQNNLQHLI